MPVPADKFIAHRDAPLAILRWCTICNHSDVVRKVRNAGRGWGMREGNKQRGRLIQHVKAEHPDLLKETGNHGR